MGSRDDEYDEDGGEYDNEPRRRTRRRGFQCPYCGSEETPSTRSQISAAGWVVFVVLLLFCLPLFWIGLLIKEEYYTCYECGMKVGG